MKILYRWILEFVDTRLSAAAAADRLVNAGIEVASVTPLAPGLRGVVVGEIEAIEREIGESHGHRLLLCRVSTGRARFRVVCGAPNAVVGARGAFAPPGVLLPGGRRIGATKLRGVESEGMLCSERELGLGEEHERGILLVDQDAPLGADLVRHLGLDDQLLEVEVTPNRPDCLSVVGVARELSALTGARFRPPAIAVEESREPARGLVRVRIDDPQLCARYAARLVRGVTVGPSPAWLAARLRAVGLRPISNVVDATNYVLWELGHPLHAFDYQTVAEGTIVVRRARAGERLKTLDGQERELRDPMLVIADPTRAIAVAGVMGGATTEVTEGTTTVLLESAYFQPTSVRRTSRALGLTTDAAYRFERGADVEALRAGLDRATELIRRVAGGTVARGVVDAYPRRRKRVTVRLRMSRVRRVLGVAPKRGEAKRILTALGFPATDRGPDLVVEVPSFRRDIVIEDDLVEEVVRVWGYDKIPATLPSGTIEPVHQPATLRQEQIVRGALSGAGLCEVITYSFSDPSLGLALLRTADAVRLLNPLSQDASQLRRHPLEGVLRAVATNLRRQQPDVRVFEIGKVYWRDRAGAKESRWAAVALTGTRTPRAWYGDGAQVDVYDAKGLAEYVLDAAGIRKWKAAFLMDEAFEHDAQGALESEEGKLLAHYGEVGAGVREASSVDCPVFAAFFNLDAMLARGRETPRYEPLARFPFVQRDMAFLVPAPVSPAPAESPAPAAVPEIEAAIREAAGPLLRHVVLFDVFPFPDGRRSLAWRLTFQADDRTLTDDEVNLIHQRVAARVAARFQITLRGA